MNDDFKARVGLFVDAVRKLCEEYSVEMVACINKYGPQIEFADRKVIPPSPTEGDIPKTDDN